MGLRLCVHKVLIMPLGCSMALLGQALRTGAMHQNFAITEFHEVRQESTQRLATWQMHTPLYPLILALVS
jgi:hypothetical protein